MQPFRIHCVTFIQTGLFFCVEVRDSWSSTTTGKALPPPENYYGVHSTTTTVTHTRIENIRKLEFRFQESVAKYNPPPQKNTFTVSHASDQKKAEAEVRNLDLIYFHMLFAIAKDG